MFEKLKSLLGLDREPRWKRKPELYYVCPECDGVAVNAKWRMRDYKTDELIGEYHGRKLWHREVQQLCPKCDEWVPMDDVLSLDEIFQLQEEFDN